MLLFCIIVILKNLSKTDDVSTRTLIIDSVSFKQPIVIFFHNQKISSRFAMQ